MSPPPPASWHPHPSSARDCKKPWGGGVPIGKGGVLVWAISKPRHQALLGNLGMGGRSWKNEATQTLPSYRLGRKRSREQGISLRVGDFSHSYLGVSWVPRLEGSSSSIPSSLFLQPFLELSQAQKAQHLPSHLSHCSVLPHFEFSLVFVGAGP